MLWAELGVGMMEAQERGAGHLRPNVHLRSPRGFLTNSEPYSTRLVQVSQALRWLHGGDNPFHRRAIDLQAVNEIKDESVIVPHRDNQRNQRTIDRIHSCHHTQDVRPVRGKERSTKSEVNCEEILFCDRGSVANSPAQAMLGGTMVFSLFSGSPCKRGEVKKK